MYTGNPFRRARFFKGLTLHELSLKTNPRVSVTQISLFERDLISLPEEKLQSLTKALGLPADVSSFHEATATDAMA